MLKKTSTLYLVFCIFSPLLAFAQNITIIYEQRAPYVETSGTSIKGLVATPLIKALDQSKVDYQLKQKPSKRHLFEIKANTQAICAVGWFKNNERQKYAKYTKAAYQDKPMGIIKRKQNTKIDSSMDIDTLLKQDIKILGKKSYSYGKLLDEKIIQHNTKRLDVSSDNSQMLTLIAKKRADFMFSSYEEATSLLEDDPLKNNLEFINLQNMPMGSKRYLICSKMVEDSIIEGINKFLP